MRLMQSVFVVRIAQDAKDLHVVECQVFNSYQGTGIAVLTTTYRLFVVNNIDDVRIRRLQAIPGTRTYLYLAARQCVTSPVVTYLHIPLCCSLGCINEHLVIYCGEYVC